MTQAAVQIWNGCVIPEDLLYDLDVDVWVRLEHRDGEVEAVVGMTDVAQTRGGRLVQVGWKKPGTQVARGRPLAVIESAKWVGPMRSPLSGVVVANNAREFELDIAAANRDPYDRGWFYRLRLTQLERERPHLADGARAYEHYRHVIEVEGLTCIRCAE